VHRKISFVDTTILCNLIPIPGRAQDREQVAAQMRAKERAGEVLILPVTAVVEAGNFIAQLPDGTARRTTAQTFERLMALVVAGNAPWQLHQFLWGEEFLQSFLAGADTGLTWSSTRSTSLAPATCAFSPSAKPTNQGPASSPSTSGPEMPR
jgi:hypothetical protein